MPVLLVETRDRHRGAELVAGLHRALGVSLGEGEDVRKRGALQVGQVVDQVGDPGVRDTVEVLAGRPDQQAGAAGAGSAEGDIEAEPVARLRSVTEVGLGDGHAGTVTDASIGIAEHDGDLAGSFLAVDGGVRVTDNGVVVTVAVVVAGAAGHVAAGGGR